MTDTNPIKPIKKLNKRQEAVVEAFLITWNKTRAVRMAGYAQANHAQYKVFQNPLIQEAIKARLEKMTMQADEVVFRLNQQAELNKSDFYEVENDANGIPHYKGVNWEEFRNRGYLVKRLFFDKNMIPTLEFFDNQSALIALGKHRGLLGEQGGSDLGMGGFTALPADVIAPDFLNAYRDIKEKKHVEYLFFGGRGSTKSSFISMVMIWQLVINPDIHGLALRQVANTLRDSVYAQLVWAINELGNLIPGLPDKFSCTTSPLEITYLPTGQKIYFRGADDPGKIKSIKTKFGHIGLLWFEELDQFHGEEAIRKIEQSVMRGGDFFLEFKSWNPPRTANNWANKYAQIPKANQYQHKSNYLTVPTEWLGKIFFEEAEHLKEVNPSAYEHEYLGISNGTGGLVFENVKLRPITDEEISNFDRITWGGDWGYYPDPVDFGPVHFNAARRILYVFGEYRDWKRSNDVLFKELVRNRGLKPIDLLILDSAEPKSVADFQKYSVDGVEMVDKNGNPILDTKNKPIMLYGPTCRGAEKGPESVKYSIKWLQGLTEIVIDPVRCPYAAEEFINYELEQDKDGDFITEYPDKNNHAIDRVRYATNLIWRRRGQ